MREPVDNARLALECAACCLAPDDLTVVIDSLLNMRLATRADVEDWLRDYPRAVARALARTDARSESGTESYVRLRLRRKRLKVRVQVQIGEVGRVDLLVGDRLVIECDSLAHHTSPASYENDRRRDRQLRALGFHVIRLTYDQVTHRWEEVEADLLAIIRRHDHLWPRAKLRRSGTQTA